MAEPAAVRIVMINPRGDIISALHAAQVATMLAAAAIPFRLVDTPLFSRTFYTRALTVIRDERPGILVVLANLMNPCCNIEVESEITELINDYHDLVPGGIVIRDGIMATMEAEFILTAGGCDIAVQGESELIMAALLPHLARGERDLSLTAGIAYLDPTGVVQCNPAAPLPDDLDHMPPVDRQYVDARYRQDRWACVVVARGCLYNCSLCQPATKTMFGRKIRYRSVRRVIDEIKQLLATGEYRPIQLWGDTFTYDRRWVEAFCRSIQEEGMRFQWVVGTRADTVDRELLSLMAAAGCIEIGFGVESGDADIRNGIIRKNVSDIILDEACRAARAAGLRLCLSFLVGVPCLTWRQRSAHVRSSAAVIRRYAPEDLIVSVLVPVPGTDVFRTACAAGCLDRTVLGKSMHHKIRHARSWFGGVFLPFIWLEYGALWLAGWLARREKRAAAPGTTAAAMPDGTPRSGLEKVADHPGRVVLCGADAGSCCAALWQRPEGIRCQAVIGVLDSLAALPPARAVAPRQIAWVVARREALPFYHGSIGAIGFLETAPNEEEALIAEARRLLLPGGVVYLTALAKTAHVRALLQAQGFLLPARSGWGRWVGRAAARREVIGYNQAGREQAYYSQQYFCRECGGHEVFRATAGTALPGRLAQTVAYATIKEGMRVLDVGCGRGELLKHVPLNQGIRIGTDFSRHAIEIARAEHCPAHTHYLLGRSEQLPLRRRSVDVVFMTDLVEHLPYHACRQTLADIAGALRPDGQLIVHTQPNRWYYDYGYYLYRFLKYVKNRIWLPNDPRRGSDVLVHVAEQSYVSLRQLFQGLPFHYRIETGKFCWYPQTCGWRGLLDRLLRRSLLMKLFFGKDFYVIARLRETYAESSPRVAADN